MVPDVVGEVAAASSDEAIRETPDMGDTVAGESPPTAGDCRLCCYSGEVVLLQW